jgi:hypothetical protein
VDAAGNEANAESPAVNIDLTAPTIAGSRAPLANGYGWNNTDVTVAFTCGDALSGVASCTADDVLTDEGTAQQRVGQVTDLAGNTASATVGGINIDKTAPTVNGSRLTPANANGWNNGPVASHFEAQDALSGIDGPPTADVTLSQEGANQTASASFTDKAGNTGGITVGGINIDLTAPVVAVPGPLTVLATSASGASVSYSATASDAGSGTAGATCSPASGATFAIGETIVTCTATDASGNTGAATFTVTVADITTPGAMHGNGFIREGDRRYEFGFLVLESPRAGERGFFTLQVSEQRPRGRNGRGPQSGTDRLVARDIDFIAFSDDPTHRPGRPRRPQVDAVRFSGAGSWKGASGYRFEVLASDEGEPGRHRESISITVWDPSGAVVAHVEGELDGGNVQSRRIHR